MWSVRLLYCHMFKALRALARALKDRWFRRRSIEIAQEPLIGDTSYEVASFNSERDKTTTHVTRNLALAKRMFNDNSIFHGNGELSIELWSSQGDRSECRARRTVRY